MLIISGWTKIKMNKFIFVTFLFSTVFAADIFSNHFGGDEYGDSDFDSDWFWMGSNLRSLGKVFTLNDRNILEKLHSFSLLSILT